MAIGDPDPALDNAAFDLTLAPPAYPTQVALRLESLLRMAVAEEEFQLRFETFADHGRRLDLPDEPGGAYRVLAVGEPAPQFLDLSNAPGPHRRGCGRGLHRLHRLRLPA